MLSVVIPCYNCSKTILKTLASIKKQDCLEYEIILVNDGSTDNTLEVLTDFCKDFKNAQVISVLNGGPSVARNIGLEKAVGDYILFVDSDDTISPFMFSAMLSLAREHSLEVVCCGYEMIRTVKNSKNVKSFSYPSLILKDRESFLKHLTPLLEAHLMYAVWNKVYNLNFLKENALSFKNFFSGEDRLFNIDVYSKLSSFGFIDQPYYQYILHGSQTLGNRFLDNRFLSVLSCQEKLVSLYVTENIYDDFAQKALAKIFLRGILSCITQLNAKNCNLTLKEKRKYVKDLLENKEVQGLTRISFKGYYKLINLILRLKNITLTLILAKLIFLIQTKLVSLYLKIKHMQ